MVQQTFTEAQFRAAVRSSLSISQALKALGLRPEGSYKTFHRKMEEYDVDISHFLGQRANKGRASTTKKPLSHYLQNKTTIKSARLKRYCFEEGVLEPRCYTCGLTEWRGQPAPLELDHINGDRHDNRLENLRILCSNCHAQTPTFRGRNHGCSR